jgi:hypothetical protein
MARTKKSAAAFGEVAQRAITQTMYVGSTILEKSKDGQVTFFIAANTIYNNVVPADVAQRRKDDPDFNMLFIDVDKAAKTFADLSNEDTAIAQARARVQKRGGKK